MPGREDVAVLLEEAMRSEGWTGGRMGEKRRRMEQRARLRGEHTSMRDDITRILDLNPSWWDGEHSDNDQHPEDADDDDDEGDIDMDDALLVGVAIQGS